MHGLIVEIKNQIKGLNWNHAKTYRLKFNLKTYHISNKYLIVEIENTFQRLNWNCAKI
jgi:hypothetical protein